MKKAKPAKSNDGGAPPFRTMDEEIEDDDEGEGGNSNGSLTNGQVKTKASLKKYDCWD